MLTHSQQEKKQLFFHYFPFAFNRILHRKDAPTGTDVLYARSSFDERGDLSYPHPDNRMAADLAFDVVEEANRMAVKANGTQSLL